VSKADLSKQPAQVSAMFDDVSTHYDRTNNVLSVGNALLWRVATTKAVAPKRGERILDLAAGKKQQAGNPNIEFLVADGMDLPFADDEFDAVTISFGLRNIVEPRTALAELYRVTKPGGRIVICEFSTPPASIVKLGYSAYLQRFMPAIAKVASSNADAYTYLADSIEAWPNQKTLCGWLSEAGFTNVGYRNLTFGIVALHRGTKPRTPSVGLTS
jgi:demethylmenaquinone methyltransferase/2-methoxy-6-polyprenyl-1,4-benzoquinol methylase